MKTTGQMAMWAVLGFLLAAGSGCMAPMLVGGGAASSVDPAPNGYYTGESHDFAARANPDPLGRKFRVAYVRAHFIPTDVTSDLARMRKAFMEMDSEEVTRKAFMKATEEDKLRMASMREETDEVPTVEELKEAVGLSMTSFLSTNAVFGLKQSMTEARNPLNTKPHVVTTYDGEAIRRLPGGLRAILGESIWQCFRDVNLLNVELEKRYPNLFTTGGNGFPLSLAMIGLYSSKNPDIRTCYEAWAIGVPEDGEWVRPLEAGEAFIDAYEASAAALLALTEEQCEGLERAEPGRRIWQE